MGTFVCSDCGRRWSGFRASWWCELCREKHIPKINYSKLIKKGGEK